MGRHGAEVLARAPGALQPKQWYRVGAAVSGSSAWCTVDETRVLHFQSPYLTEGRIGLYANTRDRPVDFDDVQVRQTLFERIFNIGTVEVVSPTDRTHPKMELHGVKDPNHVKEIIRKYCRMRRDKGALFIEQV